LPQMRERYLAASDRGAKGYPPVPRIPLRREAFLNFLCTACRRAFEVLFSSYTLTTKNTKISDVGSPVLYALCTSCASWYLLLVAVNIQVSGQLMRPHGSKNLRTHGVAGKLKHYKTNISPEILQPQMF
jgi:hypothetical protein